MFEKDKKSLRYLFYTCLCSRFLVLEWQSKYVRLTQFQFRSNTLDLIKIRTIPKHASPELPTLESVDQLKKQEPIINNMDIVLCIPMLKVFYKNDSAGKEFESLENSVTLAYSCNGGPLTAWIKRKNIESVIDVFEKNKLHLAAIYHGILEWINVPLSLSSEFPETWVYQHENFAGITSIKEGQICHVSQHKNDEKVFTDLKPHSFILTSTDSTLSQNTLPQFPLSKDVVNHPFMQKMTILAAGVAMGFCDSQSKSCNFFNKPTNRLSGNWLLHKMMRVLVWAWAGLLAFQVVVWGGNLILFKRYEKVFDRYRYHKEKITVLEEKKATLSDLKNQMILAESFFRNRTRNGWILSKISHSIPELCWLVNLKKGNAEYDRNSPLFLDGFAVNQTSVIEFTNNLQTINGVSVQILTLETVAVNDLNNPMIKVDTVYHFLIKVFGI